MKLFRFRSPALEVLSAFCRSVEGDFGARMRARCDEPTVLTRRPTVQSTVQSSQSTADTMKFTGEGGLCGSAQGCRERFICESSESSPTPR